MGNQGKADRFCKFDRLDDVGGLRDRNVFGAANTVAPLATMLRLLIGCAALAHKLDKWGAGANSPWIPLVQPISGHETFRQRPSF